MTAQPDPQEAAEQAVDPDRLLDGEDPETPRLEEALHWYSVYDELIRFKETLLAGVEAGVAAMHETAKAEVEATDRPLLEAEAERLRRRFGYWRSRVAELQAYSG